MTSPRDNHEMIEAAPDRRPRTAPSRLRITRAQLMTVIRQRVEELTDEIDDALKDLGFTGPVGRQVVLTGGGAELKNIADYMQGVLGRAVRVGRPKTITGLPEAHSGPAFSTLVGLAHAGRHRAAATSATWRWAACADASRPTGMIGRLIAAMKGGF